MTEKRNVLRSMAVLVAACASLLVLVFADVEPTQAAQKSPNVIFLIADDQDPRSLSAMPNVRKLLTRRGKTFPNATLTTPLCCPSRAGILRGQYSHNTGVLDNGGSDGGHGTFKALGRDRSTYATWLDRAGYKTGYFGKYMNGYEDETYTPPGWDRWVAADHAPATMRASVDGKAVDLDPRYETFDLAMKDYSLDFLNKSVKSPRPFLMAVSFSAPHTERGRAKYEKKYAKRFSNARWPKTPNFNEQDRSDKPRWVQRFPRITRKQTKEFDQLHRARLRSLLTVDDTVEAYVRALSRRNELSDTYIFYFTDNGWHMGNHALREGKNTPYTEDVEFPLIVRGPQVAPGTTDRRLVSNTDIAPTFADVANASPTSSVDGRSLVPLLRGRRDVPWRDALLVEGKHNNPLFLYEAVRTNRFAYHQYPSSNEEELYDLRTDPYQLRSRHGAPAYAADKSTLRSRLEALQNCAGAECRAAEGG